jgi:SAM-dependent methyltransferase
MSDNSEQREYWNGTGGQRWTTHQETLDRTVRPFGLAAMERLALAPGEHVLDVGCGCGDTLLALAERVGERGSVTGVDLSTQMLARAHERSPSATLIAGDVTEQRFARRFDALFSRFGVMFVKRVLGAAGFSQVDVAPFDADVELATSGLIDAARYAITAGPAARLLAQATPEEKSRAAEGVAKVLAPYERVGRVALHGAAWTVLARP